jgi:glycerophosphoryl diester phosphodiesterase
MAIHGSRKVTSIDAIQSQAELTDKKQPRKRGWFRRIRRWSTWIILIFSCVVLLGFGTLYFRMEFPNQIQLLGRSWDTLFLARLQGNHLVRQDATGQSIAPLIIGHRGSGIISKFDPNVRIGNTERSIRAAVKAKVDWIEIDIQLSCDGQLVVFHDRTLGTKTYCSDKWASVCDLDWCELEGLCLRLDSPEKILKLDQVLDTFSDPNLKWIFDIKPEHKEGFDQEKKEKLLPIIRELGPDRVILFGSYQVLSLYRRANDSTGNLLEYHCGLLFTVKDNFLTYLFDRESILDRCQELDVEYCVLPGMFADTSLVRRLNQAGHKVLVWDCENQIDQKNFVARGVVGLIVDDLTASMDNWSR